MVEVETTRIEGTFEALIASAHDLVVFLASVTMTRQIEHVVCVVRKTIRLRRLLIAIGALVHNLGR